MITLSLKQKVWAAIAVLVVAFAVLVVVANVAFVPKLAFLKIQTRTDKAVQKALAYVNTNLLQPGQTASMESVSEVSGLIKFVINIDGNKFDSYVTKDGKLLFPITAVSLDGKTQQPAKQEVDIGKVMVNNNPFIGNADAPVTIAYWSDYQCPFCKKMEQETLGKLFTDYIQTGKVKLVYKDYQFLGTDSKTAAMIARAVWETAPTKFYDWYLAMYAKQDAENGGWGNRADILLLTKSLGIDQAKVDALTTSNADAYQAAIDADKKEGSSFGITGTPALIVGKQFINGFVEYSTLKTAVDQVLAGSK